MSHNFWHIWDKLKKINKRCKGVISRFFLPLNLQFVSLKLNILWTLGLNFRVWSREWKKKMKNDAKNWFTSWIYSKKSSNAEKLSQIKAYNSMVIIVYHWYIPDHHS